MPSSSKISILALNYQEQDLLDTVGPLEVFGSSRDDAGERFFTATTAGPDKVHTLQWMTAHSDISYEEALNTLDQYDILLVPGAMPDVVESLISERHPVLKIIETFSKLPTRQSTTGQQNPRILMSVCTGAVLLAHLGIFQGRKCTTHYLMLERFKEILAEKGGEYESTSWVDAGYLKNGVNLISTGGNTNGTDGALHVVQKLCGQKVQEGAIATMCYEGLARSGLVQNQEQMA